MSARIEGDCLYVTKSVRIPLDCIFVVNTDYRINKTRIISERGPTYIEESLDEIRALIPDLCDDR